MKRRLYSVTRDLHLYAGLFVSPFVLVFAVSAILLNHPGIPIGPVRELAPWSATIPVPAGMESAGLADRVRLSQPMLKQVGVEGEIGPVNYSSRDGALVITASRPGSETTVRVNPSTGEATILERRTGMLDATIFLHKMPGPHLADIRRNSSTVRSWGWFADGTAWLMLFLTVSGIYLWVVVRSERLWGAILATAGVVTFAGVLYAILF